MTTTSTASPGRIPLLFLFGSGIAWLLVSGVLALIASLQLVSPGLFAGCPCLSFGRAQPLAETAFVYGWIGNAGLASVVWILSRLSGEPLRAGNWMAVGTIFWNLGVTLGLIAILFGEESSYAFLQLPAYVIPLMFAAYGAIALPGVLSWTGRRRPTLFAAQWYAIAPLFFFPWLFSTAYLLLFRFPVRGVVQAIVQGWYAQGLWTLWAAPIALACAYYVLPRVRGQVIAAYDLAPIGFWCLLFIGGWTGGRHLIGGPVPAWIPTVAIVTSFALLVHYFVVGLNLRAVYGGGGTALKFLGFALAAYLLGGILDCFTALRAVAVVTNLTFFDEALRQLAWYGAASMALYGLLYFALPRLSGGSWALSSLVRMHFACAALGIALVVVGLGAAGLVQGSDLNDAKVAFSDISDHVRPWLLIGAAGQALLLLGNLLLARNFVGTVLSRATAPVEALAT